MIAIRGAITAKNTVDSIKSQSAKLVAEIINKNSLDIKSGDVVSIVFSTTSDLNKAYPAAGIREQLNICNIPMMCLQEMSVENSLPMCIRVMLYCNNMVNHPKHVYLEGAKVLRPDLI